MLTNEDVAQVRYIVQRILVPCVFVIGVLGNSVSIYVLTRKRMRCTTNIYLTALAITDIIYLTMGLLLSLKHYGYIQNNCELYWKYYGIIVWLCDAGAYISIYIAVCFTIERFIAIRYPLKRQTFCTESLAKNVLAGVALFCLLSTLSTAFEHEYSSDSKLIDSHGRPCNLTLLNAPPTELMQSLNTNDAKDDAPFPSITTTAGQLWQQEVGSGSGSLRDTTQNTWDGDVELLAKIRRALKQTQLQQLSEQMEVAAAAAAAKSEFVKSTPTLLEALLPSAASTTIATDTAAATEVSTNSALLHSFQTALPFGMADIDASQVPSQFSGDFLAVNSLELFSSQHKAPLTLPHNQVRRNTDDEDSLWVRKELTEENGYGYYCKNVTVFRNAQSSLGRNVLYTRIWYYFTLFVFVLIPLTVLATFNCFLIMLVRRSRNLRGQMTNESSMRKPKRKSNSTSVSQENRVTVTLIAVVLLFIVCQLPWAIFLIASEHTDMDMNLQLIIGNIFNLLAAINAAANFFLYCVFSDKYRKTVRELIMGYKYHRQRQRNTQTSGSVYTNTSSGYNNGSRRYRPQQSMATVIK